LAESVQHLILTAEGCEFTRQENRVRRALDVQRE
jgi:hypothetical protein